MHNGIHRHDNNTYVITMNYSLRKQFEQYLNINSINYKTMIIDFGYYGDKNSMTNKMDIMYVFEKDFDYNELKKIIIELKLSV